MVQCRKRKRNFKFFCYDICGANVLRDEFITVFMGSPNRKLESNVTHWSLISNTSVKNSLRMLYAKMVFNVFRENVLTMVFDWLRQISLTEHQF